MHRTSRESGRLEPCIARALTGLAAVVAAVTVAACAATTARTAADYEPGSRTQTQLVKDAEGCAKEAEAHQKEFGYGQYDPTRGPYNRLYDACMQSHGYARKPAPQ